MTTFAVLLSLWTFGLTLLIAPKAVKSENQYAGIGLVALVVLINYLAY